jgi:glutathione S-transferase
MSGGLPVLYSFRRCPYAIRARLAIERAGLLVELREVRLAAKPLELLQASPKGTVPVLVLADGRVIEQSLEIMAWALRQHDPDNWLLRCGTTAGLGAAAGPAAEAQREMAALIGWTVRGRVVGG